MTRWLWRFRIQAACLLVASLGVEASQADKLKGRIDEGRYLSLGGDFSFGVPTGVELKDGIRRIPVSRFYLRAFHPVPDSIDIPKKATWFSVFMQDRLGVKKEIHSMRITVDSFSPLAVGLHKRAINRFLRDIVMPAWFSSISEDSWIGAEPEFIQLEGGNALFAWVMIPPDTIRGVKWEGRGTRFNLIFGVLILARSNVLYLLSQPAANYELERPQFTDVRKSLIEFYRTITFKSSPRLTTATGTCRRTIQVSPETIIEQIDIRGLQRVSLTEVRSHIASQARTNLDLNVLRRDVGAIRATGFFDDVRIELAEGKKGIVLIFFLTEKASNG